VRCGDLIEVMVSSPLYPTSYMTAPLGRSEGELGLAVETEYGYVRFIRGDGSTVWVHMGGTRNLSAVAVHHRSGQTESHPTREEGTVMR